jgi:hypothetical protein
MPEGYTVFVHLVDRQGETLAQADGQPLQGEFPTPFWRPGDIVRDARRLPLPAVDGEALSAKVGFYLLETGQRLPVSSGGERQDYVALRLGPPSSGG